MAPRSLLLRLIALVLPREFRERVFEPALADLLLAEQDVPASWRRAFLARIVLLVECLRIGLPRFVWERGRLTRLARAVLVVLLVIAAAFALAQRAAYAR